MCASIQVRPSSVKTITCSPMEYGIGADGGTGKDAVGEELAAGERLPQRPWTLAGEPRSEVLGEEVGEPANTMATPLDVGVIWMAPRWYS
mmetsp:Transcript_4698/g.17753  ORF Transcript_4698/g.17753 Transcript_4698/m.17753 type:complete len:90 (+) Transcript_4698:518-787(+)